MFTSITHRPRKYKNVIVASAVLLAVCGLSRPARAQGVGVRAGISGDPQQFYFGGHGEVGPVADRLWFRPNLEVGIGNDQTITTANVEFVYRLPFSRDNWRPYAGGGPALVLIHQNGNTTTNPGLNIVAGVQHRDGFFTEVKVGFADSPTIKFGVGYTWGKF